MTTQTIRARVHDGRFEPLEKISLPEGAEVTVTVDLPDVPPKQPVTFGTGKLGAPVPLTRAMIYDDGD